MASPRYRDWGNESSPVILIIDFEIFLNLKGVWGGGGGGGGR